MSDRIEAAPDVRELVERLNALAECERVGTPKKLAHDAATALTTLSAKWAVLVAAFDWCKGSVERGEIQLSTNAATDNWQCLEEALSSIRDGKQGEDGHAP